MIYALHEHTEIATHTHHGVVMDGIKGSDMGDAEQLYADIEAVFERLLEQQRGKVVEVALDILPHLTPEQIQNPQDYPAIAADTMFNYEDGFLAGLISARQALRSIIFTAHRASS